MESNPSFLTDTELAPELYPEVVEKLCSIYQKKVYPVESTYRFDEFHAPFLRECDFRAKPMVLLLGQYSVGKTSFIKFLLGRDFPGMMIGPNPTTDRFVAIMHGDDDRVIPGNAVAVDDDKPFHALNRFGASFLGKFEASECSAPVLEYTTFIDTPGVLSGEKQRIGRSYDFVSAVTWFSERCDMILLLFDAHKLDISDEFKRCIEALKGQDDKIRVVLNKADIVSSQELMRVYGALMWSLGKVVPTPEAMRVYISSFWDKPYKNEEYLNLFEAERRDLLGDLKSLPRMSAVRKINELVKRARLVKVHAFILSHLRAKMPALWGKQSKQDELTHNLLEEFREIKKKYRLPVGDFPDIDRFKEHLKQHDFTTFPKLDMKLISKIDEVLSVDIPQLMKEVSPTPQIVEQKNPFAEPDGNSWAISYSEKAIYDKLFKEQSPINGKINGAKAKDPLMATGVPPQQLKVIWDLADLDNDGQLDIYEFAIAMHLANAVKQNPDFVLPSELPESLIPPSRK
eukprot:CAMPEP_0174261932 /NCGR_PEP_ID=MMETSP0439-20130205/12672_1 /TAXON_ID=0 /ORGANISM="Stereomyxa ramosa, Strain Chinc5" /LENGTH=513 /DNA_ID=CAMNT_0015346549 /DNA_START=35 /DNA_END=1576 /DNA_ORIENTATION=-